jgi:hypothetical protein
MNKYFRTVYLTTILRTVRIKHTQKQNKNCLVLAQNRFAMQRLCIQILSQLLRINYERLFSLILT